MSIKFSKSFILCVGDDMKRILYYGFFIFIFSVGVGYYYSSIWKQNKDNIAVEYVAKNELISNQTTLETAQSEEKISYNTEFALKKYYDECGHFTFQYAELPKELINLTKDEIAVLYPDWEIEEFSTDSLILCQEINNICDEHYVVKLGENNVEIYRIGNGGALSLYRETDISKEYLTAEDIETLQKGIIVYGTGKLNSTVEDFE